MLTTKNALADLHRRLAAAGFSEKAPRLEVFWPVWLTWIDLPVQGMDPQHDEDMVLFQSSLSLRIPGQNLNPSDISPPHFGLNFTRQFSHHDEHGDYEGMEHLFVDFEYDPVPEFHAIVTVRGESGHGATMWWGRETLAEWAALVEATPSFAVASAQTPRSVRLVQSDV